MIYNKKLNKFEGDIEKKVPFENFFNELKLGYDSQRLMGYEFNYKEYMEILNKNTYENIDSGVAPVLKLLNSKGFETQDSCSGHPENELYFYWSYIHFAKDCTKKLIKLFGSPRAEFEDYFIYIDTQNYSKNNVHTILRIYFKTPKKSQKEIDYAWKKVLKLLK
ncbi:hypothetical protein KAR91_59505 [Candidatus Pacearchaeota archaeon]|nr:hypothetical protein [Candidatus Pacearchaeota archaeon]